MGYPYRIPIVPVQGTGTTIPAGINFGVHLRGVHATGTAKPSDTELAPIKASVLIAGATVQDMVHNYRAIERKLEQAMKAFGADNQGDRIALAYRPLGVADYVFYDVGEGSLTYVDFGLVDGDLWMACLLELWCLPYARGWSLADAASSTITDGAIASTIYRAAVPGDLEALLRLQIKDVGAKVIQKLRIGRRSGNGQPLAATDFTPRYLLTALSPGANHADVTALDGVNAQRITASAAWQNIGYKAVAAGARQYGVFDLIARVKDSTVPLVSPTWAALNLVTPAATAAIGPRLLATNSHTFNAASGTVTITVPAGGVPVGATVLIRLGLYVASGTFGGAPTATDSRGNTWTGIAWGTNADGEGATFISSTLTTALQAGDTITVTAAGLSNSAWTFYAAADAWMGVTVSAILATNSGSSTTPGGGSVTTTQVNDVVLSTGIVPVSADAYTPTAGQASIGGVSTATATVFSTHRQAAVAGSYTLTGTLGTTGQWATRSVVLHTTGQLVEGEYLLLYTSYDNSTPKNESFPTAAQAAAVPVSATDFFDSYESADLSQWTAPSYRSFGGSGAIGDLSVETAASLTAGIPDQVYGLRLQSGIAQNNSTADQAQVTADRAIPNSGTDGCVRVLFELVAIAGTASNRLVLVTDATHAPVLWIEALDAGGVLGVKNTAAGGGESIDTHSLGISAKGINRIEVQWRYTLNNGGANSYCQVQNVWVNDTNVFNTLFPDPAAAPTLTSGAPANYASSVWTKGKAGGDAAASSLDCYLDNYQYDRGHIGPNTGTIVSSLNAGSGQSGYYLYAQRLGASTVGGIHQVDAGNVTNYTLATLGTTAKSPPTTAPTVQNGLYRVGFATNTSDLSKAVITWLSPRSSIGASGLWERLWLGTVILPPQEIKEGDSKPPDWVVVIQGMSGGTNTSTLDADSFRLYPHRDEDYLEVAWPNANLGVAGLWVIDYRYDGRVSCEVLTADGSAVLASLPVQGQMRLGPGDNILTMEADYGSGGFYLSDVTAGQVQYQAQLAQITPRYVFGSAGAP